MTAPIEPLDRFDEVLREVRRQGRAAIAAQAAAESCLSAMDELRQALQAIGDEEEPDREPPGDATEREALVRALVPLSDALDRLVSQAERLATTEAELPWFQRLGRGRRRAEVAALAQGLDLLRRLFESVLDGFGVRIDRATGVPFDPEAHRALEVRVAAATEGPAEPSLLAERVIEVVRPGFALGAKILRETEVVVVRPPRALSGGES